MTWTFRLPRSLHESIRRDLARPHAFAAERVGFLFTKLGNKQGQEQLVLATGYDSIPDGDYIDDSTVGACYQAAVHRRILQRAMTRGEGAFHVHEHSHLGSPSFSSVDLVTVRKLVPSLRSVCPAQAHGAILLSDDSVNGLCWLPASRAPAASGRVAIVGRPLKIHVIGGRA